MLYDPKWEKKVETKADPFTLESLIAWLETKDPNETYVWADCGACLCAQYFNVGKDWAALHAEMEARNNGFRLDGLALTTPHTFGAALERARAVLNR